MNMQAAEALPLGDGWITFMMTYADAGAKTINGTSSST